MVSVHPVRFCGRPVALIMAAPPAGTPARPVTALRTGACRLIWLGFAARICAYNVSVAVWRPVMTVTVVAVRGACGFTETLTCSSPGPMTKICFTTTSLDPNPTAGWPFKKFVLLPLIWTIVSVPGNSVDGLTWIWAGLSSCTDTAEDVPKTMACPEVWPSGFRASIDEL